MSPFTENNYRQIVLHRKQFLTFYEEVDIVKDLILFTKIFKKSDFNQISYYYFIL